MAILNTSCPPRSERLTRRQGSRPGPLPPRSRSRPPDEKLAALARCAVVIATAALVSFPRAAVAPKEPSPLPPHAGSIVPKPEALRRNRSRSKNAISTPRAAATSTC